MRIPFAIPVALSLILGLHYLDSFFAWWLDSPRGIAAAGPAAVTERHITAPPTVLMTEKPSGKKPNPLPELSNAAPPPRAVEKAAAAPPQSLDTGQSSAPPVAVTTLGLGPQQTFTGMGNQLGKGMNPAGTRARPSPFRYGVPTSEELDGMEFIIEVPGGSIHALVRNVDGAFLKANRTLVDPADRTVRNFERFLYNGRWIVFYPTEGQTPVLLPTETVAAVMREVAAKSIRIPKTIVARFQESGNLSGVEILSD